MARDPGIICLRHCCAKSIFCKSVLKICPICESTIIDYIVPPFVIPYPYVNASQHPTSIVIRPSQGSFLTEYNVTRDLHIAVVNSKGIVVEFDKVGLKLNDYSKWMDCIAVNVVPSSWNNHWDETLNTMLTDIKWKSYNYDEFTMNCFNFVIQFLNNVKYTNTIFTSKEEMCEKLLLPKIRDAIKYNVIHKNVKNNDYFILN